MIPQAAIDVILSAEGVDQPGTWPGAESGVTIGFGYDLGYTPRGEFARDWRSFLTDGQISRLSRAIGIAGRAAKALAPGFRDIRISRSVALSVFMNATLPKWERLTKVAFPRAAEVLPAEAFGALVSLVFNRGTSMTGDRRREMRAIRDRLAGFQGGSTRDLQAGIAGDIRGMKRLWVGQGVDGLLTRREAEAKMVERAGK